MSESIVQFQVLGFNCQVSFARFQLRDSNCRGSSCGVSNREDIHWWKLIGDIDQHHPPAPHLVIFLEEGLVVADFMGGNSLETLATITPLPHASLFSLKKV